MSECKDCTIGLLHKSQDWFDFSTEDDLKEHIKNRERFVSCMREKYRESFDERFWGKNWSWEEYCDKRVSTDLTRFNFCPWCGKKVDWRKMKHEQD